MRNSTPKTTGPKLATHIAYQVQDWEGQKDFWQRIGGARLIPMAAGSLCNLPLCRSKDASRNALPSPRKNRRRPAWAAGLSARPGSWAYDRRSKLMEAAIAGGLKCGRTPETLIRFASRDAFYFMGKLSVFPHCQGVHQPTNEAKGIAQEIAKNGTNLTKSTETL